VAGVSIAIVSVSPGTSESWRDALCPALATTPISPLLEAAQPALTDARASFAPATPMLHKIAAPNLNVRAPQEIRA
jgi:hypothetical protein